MFLFSMKPQLFLEKDIYLIFYFLKLICKYIFLLLHYISLQTKSPNAQFHFPAKGSVALRGVLPGNRLGKSRIE